MVSWFRDSLCMDQLIEVQAETVESIKGLERWGVWWNTQGATTSEEYFYTAIGRSTCLVIVSIGPKTNAANWQMLKMMDTKHVMFWTEESEQKFNEMTR